MANTRIPELTPAIGLDGFEQIEIARPTGSQIVPYVSERTTTGAIAAGVNPVNYPVVLATPSGFAVNGRVLTGTAADVGVTDNGAGSTIVIDLISTAVTPGTYGDATHVGRFTVDQKGRLTAASSVAITGAITTVASTNGFAGAVAGSILTLSTSVTGILQGNGTAMSAASVTGTGNIVLSTSPVLTTPNLGTPSAALLTNATGLPLTTGVTGNLPVANLNSGTGATSSTFWRGDGTWAAIAASLTVGTSPIASGTSGRVLYDNAGTLGEYLISGSGSVAMTTSPAFTNDIRPSANDAASLGISGTAFSDLFLASGAIINFNAGNYTITHSAGLLTTNGNLSLTTAGVLTTGTIELGAASDTTISRSAAGVIAVEGLPVYSNIPQNSQSAAYTTVLADAQKHILHPTADNNARTFTIDSNANVAYPVGTAITFVNQINTLTIAITSDTLVFAGPGTTGSRTLAASGLATALKVASTVWFISGAGLT